VAEPFTEQGNDSCLSTLALTSALLLPMNCEVALAQTLGTPTDLADLLVEALGVGGI